MRIRQVRPEFFTDATMAALSPAVRLTYIGLWCVADDAGWLTWDVRTIGALLYPYESIRVRERRVQAAGDALEEAHRIARYECGCALIPRLEDHQKIGGNKSFPVRDKHKSIHSRTSPPVTLGNGRVGNVTVDAGARADGAPASMSEFRAKVPRPA